ncbi:MAG: TIGR02996 domain-containing protein, partial [Kofleriaceae bacterium]
MAKAKSNAKKAAAPSGEPGAGQPDALLAEILAAPDDRAPRLVYADRLIEAGDPRGTFIAQQCLLLDIDPLDERYAPMLASTRRLEAAHARGWVADYVERISRAPSDDSWVSYDRLANARFEGGFLQRIAMRPEHIADEWPRLRSREPIRGI